MRVSKEKFRIKIYTFIIVLFPILNVYKIFLPLGDIIAIACILPLHFNGSKTIRNRIQNEKKYIYFLIYCLIFTLFMCIISKSIIIYEVFAKNLHLWLYMYYAIVLGKYYFDKRFFTCVIQVTASVVAVVQIIEQLVYTVLGKQLYLILPNIELNYTVKEYSDYIKAFTVVTAAQGYRPSSIFLEPSHYVIFIVLVLALRLSKKEKNKNDYIASIIYIISILMAYSTIGVVSAIICIVYYILFCHTEKKETKELVFKAILIVFGGIATFYITLHETRLFSVVLERITSIGSTVYDTSGNRRILRGLLVWQELPFLNKIFGTGIGNLLGTIINNEILVLTDSGYTDEMNTLFYLMCSTGVIGTFLYFKSIISGFLKKDNFNRLIVILFLVNCTVHNLLLQSTSVLYLVLIFISDSVNVKNKKVKNYA